MAYVAARVPEIFLTERLRLTRDGIEDVQKQRILYGDPKVMAGFGKSGLHPSGDDKPRRGVVGHCGSGDMGAVPTEIHQSISRQRWRRLFRDGACLIGGGPFSRRVCGRYFVEVGCSAYDIYVAVSCDISAHRG